MSDNAPAVDTAAAGAAAPEVHDEHSAASAIERLGLLGMADDAGDQRDTESGASAPDAGAEETPPTGDEEGQSEPEDGETQPPAIEPPQSWSAEDKALFGKLPPEAQAVVARRESERDKVVSQRTQEAAEARKAVEAEREAVQGQTRQYLQTLEQLAQAVVPEAEQLRGIDWNRLATENPAEYVRLSAQRDALRERFERVKAAHQHATAAQQAEAQKRAESYAAEQRKLLADRIPDFADSEKGPKLAREIADHLKSAGFAPEEIGQIVDHRHIDIARKAMLWDKAEAAAKAAQAKRANPAPQVQRPGSAPDAGDSKSRRIAGLKGQASKTGSLHDAARYLAEAGIL